MKERSQDDLSPRVECFFMSDYLNGEDWLPTVAPHILHKITCHSKASTPTISSLVGRMMVERGAKSIVNLLQIMLGFQVSCAKSSEVGRKIKEAPTFHVHVCT